MASGSGTKEAERHLASVNEEGEDTEQIDPEEELARAADAAGMTVEDLAAQRERELEEGGGEEEPKPTPPMQIPLPGTVENISSSFGGSKPTSSEMRLLGGKMPIEGQFSKGDTVILVVEAKVTSVEGLDVQDDWGNVQRTIRRHKARMISVRRASE